MMMEMLAVRDAKAEAFMQPFFAQSVSAGVRAFGDAARNPQEPLGLHPEDYALFHIGTFNPGSGEFEVLPQLVKVVEALNLVAEGPRK